MARSQYLLTNKLPAVNSNEYWQFRKSHPSPDTKGITHAKFIVGFVARGMSNDKIDERTPETIWMWIVKNLDTAEVAKSKIGSEKRQLLQYLNQLEDKGISALINKISIYDAE